MMTSEATVTMVSLETAAKEVMAVAAEYEAMLASVRADNGAIAARVAALEEALEAIETTCTEEIDKRRAGMDERNLQGYRVLSLLEIPRNIARAALHPAPVSAANDGETA